MPGPLRGIRVIDMTSYIAGPFACSLLADLGATVIKVEQPEGDMMRYYPSSLPEESRTFLGVNRGKQSIVIDLKAPGGKEALFRLTDAADVIADNMRPGVMRRLGVDYPVLRARNPRLIHLGLTGYGDDGPMAASAGYDQVLQAMAGIATAQGHANGVPPQLQQGSVVDFYASAMGALGVVAALFERCRSAGGQDRGLEGEGQHVGMSLLAATLAMQAGRFVAADGEPADVDRDLHNGKLAGIHPTKEGYLYLQASTPRFWENLCTLVGLPELARDERYDTVRKRAARAQELLPPLHAALRARTAVEWDALMQGQVPCAVVGSINGMFDHPQVLQQGLVERMPHAALGSYRGLARPIVYERSPLAPVSGAPGLGEHTDAVMADAGLSPHEIAALRASGAIR
ncbi:CoA transferase [Pigmentiphaga soli]|uniref:CoA transferase n=1 Tax=Pigmentiphaga soli TaxID=1007095 RepID=A0ABP8HLN9_9BURK